MQRNSLFALVLVFAVLTGWSQPIVISPTVYCTHSLLSFSPSSVSPSFSYTWGIVPGKDVQLESNAHAETLKVRFTHPLNYTIYLTVAGGEQEVTYARVINVAVSPTVSFNAYLNNTGHPNELVLTNFSKGIQKSFWRFDNGHVDSSYSLVKEYNTSGSYTVTLIGIGLRGCRDSSSHSFRIADSSSLVLPNIFTPNGDGINDFYRPQCRGISTLSAWVIARSGAIMYRWDKPAGGWDGHNFAGEACAAGEYLVIVEATGFDGRRYKEKSTITLVR